MLSPTIKHYLKQHERILQEMVSKTKVPAPRIKEAMVYALFPGGKRLRPLLVYLGGNVVGIRQEVLHILAVAVELIHCYSLVHDDLPGMDNDDLRRGKQSCHKAFDEATAILAGNGMQILALDILLNELPKYLSLAQVFSILRALLKVIGFSGLLSGQCLDICELVKVNSESKLVYIHNLKTGKLISACFTMVLLATNDIDPMISNALRNFSHYLGLVFQIQDDYMDKYEKTQARGKAQGSDVANQKFTFASLHSQLHLTQLIKTYFAKAKETLTPLAAKATDLLALTAYLEKRTSF